MSLQIDARSAPTARVDDASEWRPARRAGIAGFAAVNAVAAWFGAVALVVGWIDFGERLDQRLPLDSCVLAGAALAIGVAVPLTALARAALITAGNVPDEAHAAASLAVAAPDRVTVWTVPEADHTGGYTTAPDRWRHHVLEFLDRHLR